MIPDKTIYFARMTLVRLICSFVSCAALFLCMAFVRDKISETLVTLLSGLRLVECWRR